MAHEEALAIVQTLQTQLADLARSIVSALADNTHVQGGVVDSGEFCPATAP